MTSIINQLLDEYGITPMLCDIGAAGSPPEIWSTISERSVYLGFDADDRELQAGSPGRFQRTEIVRRAVTESLADNVEFYLTASPFCSSTLPPDHTSLAEYLFSDLFRVEGKQTVAAANLNSVLEQLDIPRIDWFKTDSQGTDLRLFLSLDPEIRTKVLAVDLEPGLIDAYQGEDLFVDVHRELQSSGFWISRLNVCGSVRMRQTSLAQAVAKRGHLGEEIYRSVRPSPAWCEVRYLRSLSWLDERLAPQREYLLLWVFALLDQQPGFALDLGYSFRQRFGGSALTDVLTTEPLKRIQKSIQIEGGMGDRIVSRIGSWLGSIRDGAQRR